MARITYLTSGQPKPCRGDTRPTVSRYIFESICAMCGGTAYATKGPSFVCLDCFTDLKAKVRRSG